MLERMGQQATSVRLPNDTNMRMFSTTNQAEA
jgi:hypothetical protein